LKKKIEKDASNTLILEVEDSHTKKTFFKLTIKTFLFIYLKNHHL